jgi:hypothetical protein
MPSACGAREGFQTRNVLCDSSLTTVNNTFGICEGTPQYKMPKKPKNSGRPLNYSGRPLNYGGRPLNYGGRPLNYSGRPLNYDGRLLKQSDRRVFRKCSLYSRQLPHRS